MNDEKLDLPREQYEPVISQPVELGVLALEVTLDVFDIHGNHEVKTCYGDVYDVVNALRDYSRLLEMVCDTWDLQGFHRAKYEYHAEKLRKIAQKYQTGIGYDYDAAMEKCKKKAAKKSRADDPGGDAMTMALFKKQREAEAKAEKAAAKAGTSSSVSEDNNDSPWDEDE